MLSEMVLILWLISCAEVAMEQTARKVMAYTTCVIAEPRLMLQLMLLLARWITLSRVYPHTNGFFLHEA